MDEFAKMIYEQWNKEHDERDLFSIKVQSFWARWKQSCHVTFLMKFTISSVRAVSRQKKERLLRASLMLVTACLAEGSRLGKHRTTK